MSILKLRPSCKDYLWGGHRLKEEYGKKYEGEILAETWELSCHPDGPSYIENGPYAGKTLQQYIDREGKEVLGANCRRFRDFPILTKFIDARDNLSIQVHPDNGYALKNEGQYGKTEMWYVMDAGEDAYLYYGFKKEISKEEFEKRIQKDTLLEVLNAVPVQKGDVLFIESGTIHAIGKNILIAEIQQNSNITYRVYDYGRVGKDGKKRDLHIEKALAVTNRVPIVRDKSSYPHVADCDYFTVDKLNLDGRVMKMMEGNVSEESFASILILDGEGLISCQGETLKYKKGDSFFLPAGSGDYMVEGSCDALITTIRAKAAPVRIGIDIQKEEAKIGLIDIHRKLLAFEKVNLESCGSFDEILDTIGKNVLELMGKHKIPMDQCIGAGIGIPENIEKENSLVNNAEKTVWKKEKVMEKMGKYLPIPLNIASTDYMCTLGAACVV
ncbi:MAG: type I phosphomannose isomerase catalytic subunit [Blautia sp.]|nr:type I phosphomannose isomerase catalytic subunit [Blautia sp.]